MLAGIVENFFGTTLEDRLGINVLHYLDDCCKCSYPKNLKRIYMLVINL